MTAKGYGVTIIKKSPEDKEQHINETDNRALDLGKLLEERERLESILQEKFTRIITVMFTDCKGSTAITDLKGDMAWRLTLQHYNNIVFRAIKEHNGILVKTMGDGTMSYFSEALDAIRSAVYIQKNIAELNKDKKSKIPIQIRIGLHTGSGIVEKNDIFGDVVNVAARFEGLANPDEIYFSEDTFNALLDKEEINCRFIKKSLIKGKNQPYKIYRAFWKEGEFEKAVFEGYSLKLHESGGAQRTIPINKNKITIGRTDENDIVLHSPYISRLHARMVWEEGSFYIEDVNSSLGTLVNGKKISRIKLKNNDKIKLGATGITFMEPGTDDNEAVKAADSDICVQESMFMLVAKSKDGKIKEYNLSLEGLMIGRAPTNDVILEDKRVSRRHARIYDENGKVFIEDLGSNNGTFLEGRKIIPRQKVEVLEKQVIKIASHSLTVVHKNPKPLIPQSPNP